MGIKPQQSINITTAHDLASFLLDTVYQTSTVVLDPVNPKSSGLSIVLKHFSKFKKEFSFYTFDEQEFLFDIHMLWFCIQLKLWSLADETKRQSLTNGSAFVKNGSVEAGSDSEEEILTYRLKIHDTDLNDAGRWRCEVKDKYGTASASCNLDVYSEFGVFSPTVHFNPLMLAEILVWILFKSI